MSRALAWLNAPWSARRRSLTIYGVLAVVAVALYLTSSSTTDGLRDSQQASCVRGNAAKAAQDIVLGGRPAFLILDCDRTTDRHHAVPLARPGQAAFIARVRACLLEFKASARPPTRACVALLNGSSIPPG